MEHLEAFQQVADENGGNRAAGLPGYKASVDYVVERLKAAGYDPDVQEFQFDYFEENSELERISPNPTATSRAASSCATPGPRHPRGGGHRAAALIDLRLDAPTLRRTLEQRMRGGRLRRIHGGQHRADAARHVRLRAQGLQRPGSRGQRRSS